MSIQREAQALSSTTHATPIDARSAFGSLSRPRRVALSLAVPLFGLLWVGGVLSRWVGPSRADEGLLASLFLLTAGLIVLLGEATMKGIVRLVAVALLGFAVEAFGVRSGFPFGEYAYTGVLRPQLLGVPVVMGFAWMTLVAFASDFAWRLRLRPWLACVCAALLTTATDLVIDPLAAGPLNYWRWAEGGTFYDIPFTNFVGWFVTALLACRLHGARGRPNFCAALVGTAIVLFFALNALAVSLFPVALIGFGLCAVRLAHAARHKR